LARLTPSRHAATPYSIIWKPTTAFGGIDILINNAGAYEAGPWIC